MQLLEIRDRVKTLPTLETKLENLIQSIRTTESEVKEVLNQYEKESHDVEGIQKDSFSNFLSKLVGKYEDKLEKEQLEQINAKTSYDRAIIRLEQLNKDRDYLTARIKELTEDKMAYEKELDNRKHMISGDKQIRYSELENKHKIIIAQLTEIEEALKAANNAMSTAENISKSLDSADGWATFDLLTNGGILTHMAKYSHIDEAEQNFNILAHNLQELKSELSDVNGLSASGLNEIPSGQRTIDFWFDNIFTDLSVRSQIKDNAEQINNLIRNIDKTKDVLISKRSELEKELDKHKKEEEELLLSV